MRPNKPEKVVVSADLCLVVDVELLTKNIFFEKKESISTSSTWAEILSFEAETFGKMIFSPY